MPRKAKQLPPPPKQESRRERFERIGRARMNKALTTIRLLGNLSSPNYEWSSRDVRAFSDTLQFAVNETLLKFQQRQKSPPLKFKFPTESEVREREKQAAE